MAFRDLIGGAAARLARDKLLLALLLLTMTLSAAFPREFAESVRHADYNSLALIACLLLASRALVTSGAVENAALALVRRQGGSGRRLMLSLTLLAYALSAIVTNDGAALILVPLAVSLARISGADRLDYVVPVLLAVNTGSFLTPFGNPQNIIIWQHYGVHLHQFIKASLPPSMVGLLLLSLTALRAPDSTAGGPRAPPRVKVDQSLAEAASSILALDVILGEAHMGVYALILTLAALLALRPYLARAVDWSVLAMFFLIFVDLSLAALLLSPMIPQLDSRLETYIAGLALSQAISNVPATIALLGFTSHWRALLLGVNIAGYATPLSSLANLLGLRIAGLGGRDYTRRALPFTLAMATAGLLLVVAG